MMNSRPGAMASWGGDTTQIIETHKALRHLGVDAVIASEQGIPDWASCDLVHIFNMQTAKSALALLRQARAAHKPAVLSTIYWDLCHARHPDNLRFGESLFWARLAAVAPRLALRFHSLRNVTRQGRLRVEQGELLREAGAILPNSVAELEILVSEFRRPDLRAKAVIVPNAVNTPVALQSSEDCRSVPGLPDRLVLMAASFHPIKGQARLLTALMREPQIPLVLAGGKQPGSRYARFCERLAAKRGNTYLLDAVPHQDMPQLYRRAKVHALPSLRESPGLASLEAAVHGANCVVSIHAPVQEYFGTDAFVCDPLDSSSLCRAVLAAWHAPFNSRLKDRILSNFTWRHAAEQTRIAYDQVLR